MVSLTARTVKNLPAMPETWVQSLGREDPLKKGMATHSSILAWRIPWTEKPGGLQSTGYKESDTTERLTLSLRYTLPYLKWIINKYLLITQGTLLSIMWQPGWEGSLGENGYMYD